MRQVYKERVTDNQEFVFNSGLNGQSVQRGEKG